MSSAGASPLDRWFGISAQRSTVRTEAIAGLTTFLAMAMVGLFMMREVTHIDFSRLDEGPPAFIIIVMIALSYSISAGLAFGFLAYVVVKLMRWRAQDIKPAMWVIAGLSLLHLIV